MPARLAARRLSVRRGLVRRWLDPGLEGRLAVRRQNPPRLDLGGEVTCHAVAVDLAERRLLITTPRLLDERTSGVKAAGTRRVRGAREISLHADRASRALDRRVRDRDGREERDRVRV